MAKLKTALSSDYERYFCFIKCTFSLRIPNAFLTPHSWVEPAHGSAVWNHAQWHHPQPSPRVHPKVRAEPCADSCDAIGDTTPFLGFRSRVQNLPVHRLNVKRLSSPSRISMWHWGREVWLSGSIRPNPAVFLGESPCGFLHAR